MQAEEDVISQFASDIVDALVLSSTQADIQAMVDEAEQAEVKEPVCRASAMLIFDFKQEIEFVFITDSVVDEGWYHHQPSPVSSIY
jgi:hypothetical protein